MLSSYDIYAQDGAGKAVVKTFENVSVSDGALNIAFTSAINNAIISAIEFMKAAPIAAATVSTLKLAENAGLSLKVYPNPNPGDKVRVDLTNFGKQEAVTINVYTVTGHAIYSKATKTDIRGASNTEIDFDRQLRRGVYIIRATSASGSSNTKLFIE